MKRRHLLVAALSLIISICMCFGLAACGSDKDEPTPVTLATPVVTINESGVASWAAVEHADGYAYKIGDTESSTTATSVTLEDGQTIAVKAVGDGKSYTDSAWSAAKTYTASPAPVTPTKLGTPAVTIDANGVASWAAVANASKYAYKINGGEEKETTATTVTLEDGQSIVVKAVGNGTTYTDGEWSAAKTYTASPAPVTPTKLGTPTVTVDENGVASWATVANASKYAYKIGDGEETETTATSVTLEDGQSIVVKAVGNGTTYTDGEWSTSVSYEKIALEAPVIEATVSGVHWAAVEDATGYICYITHSDGTQETKNHTASEVSIALQDNDEIYVVAVGTGIYKNSPESNTVTYHAPSEPTPILAPNVTISIDGTASWDQDAAVSFVYKINDGEEVTVDKDTVSVTLNNGDTIVVKAIADENISYELDSEYSSPMTYKAPTYLTVPENVSIEIEGTTAGKVVVSWDAVENAKGYEYSVNGTTTTTTDTTITITLAETDMFKVKAVGDTDIDVDNGDYSAYIVGSDYSEGIEFDIDTEKTYSVSEMVKLAIYYGTAGTTQEYIVSGVVSSNTAYDTGYGNIEITLKEGDVTFIVFRAVKSDTSWDVSTVTVADDLVNYTITAKGCPVNYLGKTPEFAAGCIVTEATISDEARVDYAIMVAMSKAPAPAVEITEETYTYTFAVSARHGTTIGWTFAGLDAVSHTYENGVLTVTRSDNEIEFTATATVSYGEVSKALGDALSFNVEAAGEEVEAPVKPTTSSFTSSGLGYANAAAVTTIECDGGAKITFAKGSGSTAPAYYTSGTNIRVYSKNTIKVEVSGTLKSITFTCSTNYLGTIEAADGYTVSSVGTTITVTFDDDAEMSEVTFTNTSTTQLRITAMEISFIAA